MLHLHHCLSARSFRPRGCSKSCNSLPTANMLPFPPGAGAQLSELNPLGTVPLLDQGMCA